MYSHSQDKDPLNANQSKGGVVLAAQAAGVRITGKAKKGWVRKKSSCQRINCFPEAEWRADAASEEVNERKIDFKQANIIFVEDQLRREN